MNWQDRALFLCERLGPGAKLAVRTLLDAALPHSPGAALLAWQAVDSYRWAKNAWTPRKRAALAASAADARRVSKLLGVLGDELVGLLAAVAARQDDPDASRRVVTDAAASDPEVRGCMQQLAALGGRFERPALPPTGVRTVFTDFPLRTGLAYG